MNPTLPGNQDRVAIIGPTGSGKTVFSLWHLSQKDFKVLPWIIIDFKGEDFNDLKARRIKYDVPQDSGLYILQPRLDERKDLHEFLWNIWESGNIGIYVDESYMIDYMGANEPYIALLTQGRSKFIPMFNLVQRPVNVTRFIFSEAEYIQMFELSDVRDKDTVQNFTPKIKAILPEFHSWYFDKKKKLLVQFKPAPEKKKIIEDLNSKLFTRKI